MGTGRDSPPCEVLYFMVADYGLAEFRGEGVDHNQLGLRFKSGFFGLAKHFDELELGVFLLPA